MFPDNYECENQMSIFDWLKEKGCKMYKCNNCGYEFEEPNKVNEFLGSYQGAPAYETWYVCPNCLDNDYKEIEEEGD